MVHAPLSEIFLPRTCAGCGRAGLVLCDVCRARLATPPVRISTTVPTGVPVFACGTYAEAHRGVVLAAKERGNVAIRKYIGAVFDAALKYLIARGEVHHDLMLVPAPTRARSARLRGGDPVQAFCEATSFPVSACVRIRAGVADQSELSASQRRNNMLRAIELVSSPPKNVPLVLVDDIVTTGSTLAATAARITAAGGNIRAAIALAYA